MVKTFAEWWSKVGKEHPAYKWESEERKEEIRKLSFDAWYAAICATGYVLYEKEKKE